MLSGAQPRASGTLLPDEAAERIIAGRYRVHNALGRGGMASVWTVEDEITGRRLALKRLSKRANARHVALFQREYYTLASLRHPCIVEVYDYASDAKGPFYTMERLDGSDLAELAPKPWAAVCRILRDVALVLALLHARRLVHRDISARNVWLTPEGRVKLIDFGTMATFGKPGDVAGTPPFVAPESLRGPGIDQRTDLYSLGALGYFLLSGMNAFPARTLAGLEAAWKERPRSASHRVAELKRDDLPEVPAELEKLLQALLSRDPLARPTTAVDVVDRLNVIGSLERDTQVRAVDSSLSSPAFVGRTAERGTMRAAFASARARKASSVVVESAPGLGRTRLLVEFALETTVAEAVVLQADPHLYRETYGVAQQFALRLLDALPAEALAAAQHHASTLGHLSHALRERLGLAQEQLAVMPQAHGETRLRVLAALRDWFLDVAREHPVVLIADDLEAFDEASAAWLAALAREANTHQLLVVAALGTDSAHLGPAATTLRQGATRLALQPLSREETSELFRSVFGDVQHLARFAEMVYQRSEGNPGHAVDLAEHLGREGVVAYVEGAWVLPQTIDAASLPANRADAEIARLARLPAHARAIGQALSIREGPIPLEMCAGLAEVEGQALFEGLEALVREGIIVGSAAGYHFSREWLRKALRTELDEDRARRAHARLGKMLLASNDVSQLERLRAGVHLLLGGDDEGGSRAVAEAGRHYGLVELADLGPAGPSLEVALGHFRASRRSRHELASLLAPLALAGYYADRHLAARYGEEAVDALQTIVGLKLARRLSPFLGRKASLWLALAVAGLGFLVRARNPRVPTFREAIMLLFNCVAALTGVCTICIDPAGGKRFASVLEPLTALGPDHVASFMRDFCLNLVATVQDRVGDARARWLRMTERLDRPNAVRDLPQHVHALYLAGALYARGVAECMRDDSQALECAERLDRLNLKLYEMSADQVRMMYHANRGNQELFDRYRTRVEAHAIQRGTAWQVETWAFSGLVAIYVRTQDTARIKDCAEQLKRLSAEVPSLRVPYARALGAYLLLRGTPSEALTWLGEGEEPLELIGWARGEGLRARAYNTLGDHARARALCLRALEYLTEEDLKFCALNLVVQIELARAEAGLGNVALAEQQLLALAKDYEPRGNPLTLGTLHEALAEMATLRRDEVAFARHLAEVERWFRATGNPSLVARYERLANSPLSPSSRAAPSSGAQRAAPRQPRMETFVHRLRHGGDRSLKGSAVWALEQLSEFAGLPEAHLFLADGELVSCVARIGPDDNAAAIAQWVGERLRDLGEHRNGATCTLDSETDPNRLAIGDTFYRLTVLVTPAGEFEEIIGAVVLPRDTTVPFPVLRTIADRLSSTTA